MSKKTVTPPIIFFASGGEGQEQTSGTLGAMSRWRFFCVAPAAEKYDLDMEPRVPHDCLSFPNEEKKIARRPGRTEDPPLSFLLPSNQEVTW